MRRSGFKRRLRDDLHAARPPRAAEAERRAWEVVREAHSEREAVRRPAGPRRLAVAALAELSPEHRAVVVLRFVFDYTPGEIARALDMPRGTVNSRLRRALDRLGEAIER